MDEKRSKDDVEGRHDQQRDSEDHFKGVGNISICRGKNYSSRPNEDWNDLIKKMLYNMLKMATRWQ